MFRYLLLTALTCSILACEQKPPTLFTDVGGVDFTNTIPENDSVNILLFEYIYNGGGVGVGDFDKDGHPDLVFSGNFVSSRIYLQKESWAFTDVTEAAGLTTDVWCSGVNVSDVDGNGWEDIYFATLNPSGDNDIPNRLYLNQGTNENGIPVFQEAAAAYGIADLGYGTHSAWFDLENDGDLDLYVLNNAIEDFNRNVAKGTDTLGKGKSVDRIYLRNDLRIAVDNYNSIPEGFTFDSSRTIQTEGWGLGLTAQDFNGDHLTDLYVANDFLSDDFLLMNQGDGTFRDELRQRLPHQSRNSMGVDVADLTGDSYPEIMVVDMLPDDNSRKKTMFGDIPHQGAATEIQRGYARQYIRNTLQLNNGDGTWSDVAFQAGVAATDWSWTPLLMDVDNDGRRDIFVSNGYPKDITNKDFIDFSDQSTMFGTTGSQIRRVSEALREVGGVHQPNYLFRNEGDLRFTPTTWLPDAPTYSNGSVLVDLDGDGDLDLVTNNINEPAGILRNHLRERQPDSSRYLQLDLEGPPGNPDALGAKVWVKVGEQTLYHEHHRQRGYLSTVGQIIHFGLGTNTTVDEVLIRFPDGRGIRQANIPGDQRMSVVWDTALPPLSAPASAPKKPLFSTQALAGPVHKESFWSDFNVSALALRDHSHNGPAMVAIDVDGDGTDELAFGGAAGQSTTLWKQEQGALTQVQSIGDATAMEVGALAVIPTNNAPVECLYIAAGSTEMSNQKDELYDLQAYANAELDGDTVQLIADNSAPPINVSTVVSNKKRGNDLWVFLGNRMSTDNYLMPDASVILRPDQNEAALLRPAERLALGMVTAAAAADFDGDGLVDLATAGDYVPLQIIRATANGFANPTPIPNTAGWHYSLTATDLDADGDMDLLLGNAGLNIPYRATPDQPLVLLTDDYDNNGTVDPVITAFNGNVSHPVSPRNTLTKQLPSWKKMLQSYALYGAWTAEDVPAMSPAGIRREAVEFRSLYLENDGQGNFTVRPLPALAQTAPIRDALEIQLPDGRPALLCVQNDYATEPLGGRFDGGTGFALTLGSEGQLEVLPQAVTLPVDARSIVRLRNTTGEDMILVGVNDGAVVQLLPGSD